MTALRQFWTELRRRRVIRVLIWYAIAGWVVIQVAATILPGLQVPQWSVTLVIVLVALGLPLAAALAWAFEIADDRIRRTADLDVAPAAPATPPAAPPPPGVPVASPSAFAARGEGARRSIAVLPFANLTGDASKDFLGEGLAEELIHTLARLPDLRVPARTSSFAYKGRNTDLRRIAQELDVGTVLEGSVRAAGERIRITAQLIDGESGYHLWSQHYDRRFEDLFELQDELASAIILQTLNVAIEGLTHGRMQRAPPTRNLDAYLLYLGAAFDLASDFRVRPAFEKLQEALRLDPDFARARSFMVHVWAMGFVFGVPLPGRLADAEQEALRVLERTPDSALTHASLGIIRSAQARWLEAEASFRRAKELDPTDPDPWVLHAAYLLGSTGHVQAALTSSAEAVRLAPSHPVFTMHLGMVNAAIGNDVEARRQLQAAMDLGMERTTMPLCDLLSQLERRQGRHDAAARLLQESLTGSSAASRYGEAIALVFDSLAGRRERSAAIRALDALRAGAAPAAQPEFMRRRMLLWYSMLESYDQAFEIMHSSLDEFAATSTIGVAWVFLWMKELAGFRADPRFAEVVARMRMPDYWERYGPPDGYDWRDGRLIAR
jgi:TolB-like protein/Flp pilus assembly protein TadD